MSEKTKTARKKAVSDPMVEPLLALVLFVALGLIGAAWYAYHPPTILTNDQVIADTQKCESAGLRAAPESVGYDILAIHCEPRP